MQVAQHWVVLGCSLRDLGHCSSADVEFLFAGSLVLGSELRGGGLVGERVDRLVWVYDRLAEQLFVEVSHRA